MSTETIEASMPGVFYRRPDPDEEYFVEEGDEVTADNVVCLIGVMKNFHEISAGTDGIVTEFHVENEQEVQAGDSLFEIETE